MKIFKALISLAFLSVAAMSVFAQSSGKIYVEGELLVKFKSGTASSFAAQANDQIGARVLEEFADLGWQRVQLPKGISVETAIVRYANFADVAEVQPNFYYHLLATPNDTQYNSTGMYGMAKISAPSAWDLTTGSSAVVVADIDTGMRYTHEDLAANAWTNSGEVNGNGIDDDGNGFIDDFYGWDFFYNDSNPIDDAGGHGTHTAGTIGAVGNNAKGVVGVNWNVKIMPIKIYSPVGTDSTSAMLVNAYNYIRLMKNRGVNIRVTNNSYGGCNEACGYDQATKDALDAMGNVGILNVFAAGNAGQNIETTPFYPASYTSPSVLSVASSTSTDARSGFSNYGVSSVDVAAPGSNILSTYNSSNTSYATLSGTSMASPHGAGAAALLFSHNPNLSVASLKATLMNTVDPLAAWSGVVKTGGRLNVDRALRNQTICAFNLSQNQFTVAGGGGSQSVNVTAGTNCDYSAISSAPSWIAVSTGSPGSGSGTITFTVQSNPGAARSGTINVGGTILTINQVGPIVAPNTNDVLDFDGDGRTDYSAIQNNGGTMTWQNQQSTNGYAPVSFGLSADDFTVPADYDGDGKTDIAVWRRTTGTFYVMRSANGTMQSFQFGQTFDNPYVTQDFDGDGKTDFAVTRLSNGNLFWYIYGTTSGFRAVQFGNADDKPIRGDFDGDGEADVAVYRLSNGSPANTFFIQRSSDNGLTTTAFGTSATDTIVPADYDGDGKTDIAVWRRTTGVWYYAKSSTGIVNAFQFGQPDDIPAIGDYDGDGKTDFAVWRRGVDLDAVGYFYVQNSTNGFSAFGWGNSRMAIVANLIN